jgi:hypothetical protein
MEGGDEQPAGNAHTLLAIIALQTLAFGTNLVNLLKHHHDPRDGFKERLVPIGAQRSQRLRPFRGHSATLVR